MRGCKGKPPLADNLNINTKTTKGETYDFQKGQVRRCGRVRSALRGVLLGGNLNNGLNAGRFACNANNAPSNSNWNYSASLS